MEKNINDIKYKEYKKNKIFIGLILLFTVLTIILAVLSLFKKISIIFPIITFVIYTVLTRVRYKDKLKKNVDK